MSGADSDFGGFDEPVANRSKPVSSSKPGGSRAQAGSSKSAGGAAANGARRRAITLDDSGDEEVQQPPVKKGKPPRSHKQQEREEIEEDEVAANVVEVEGDDIEEVRAPTVKSKSRVGSKKPAPQLASAPANGTNGPATKGKGKAKAKPPSRTRAPSVEEMEVEVVEQADDQMEVEIDEDLTRPNHTARTTTARGIKNARPHPSSTRRDEVLQLQEQLAQANAHISDLTRQLDELYQVRHTEPEQLLERMEAQYKAQTQAQDNLIDDLKAKLSRSDPLLRSGKTTVFELLTREEANREKEDIESQLRKYKDIIRDRDQRIKEKDETITNLEQEKKDIQYELKAEIERGKFLAANAKNQRPPGSTTRVNAGPMSHPNHDPKFTEIIKFYEDLTNVIIPTLKVQNGRYLDTSEWIMQCCYTYKDVTDNNSQPKSLMFSIRLCYDLKSGAEEPVTDKNQLVESVHYLPKELDKERPEFVESLGFLSDAFTFERDQLSLFLRTLHDNMSGEADKDEDSEDLVDLVQ